MIESGTLYGRGIFIYVHALHLHLHMFSVIVVSSVWSFSVLEEGHVACIRDGLGLVWLGMEGTSQAYKHMLSLALLISKGLKLKQSW